MQVDLTKIMFSLKSIISKKIENITDKSEKQKKEILAAPNSILTNLTELVKKKEVKQLISLKEKHNSKK